MDSVFREIYEEHHQDLFQFLFYMVKSREEAEDLVQEVYIRIMKAYHTFEGRSSKKTWLFSIAKNVAIDHFRKQKGWKGRLYETFDWDRNHIRDIRPLPEEIALQNEEIRQLYKCLDRCTTNQRLVLVMRFLNGLTITETATSLNWSESKVKTTQHRAIKQVKSMMERMRGKEEDDHEL
ncbi:RNA polymerase sigma factor SigX [Bacillus sp. FJAT-50079]|uniref:RNA polymerase sigma factor SigX n=1 Tax=Bacillus sp. FJAT-50079 TaxID=2833577 RepID=UPI001BC91043|nr:RNA polymerase sigma factor SigX [Bacillus sp. FJAT-50079]MBS4209717.1 RNA polymerase sigma factor SigX [Bacillus sp. FJAT-50079]